MIPPFTCKHKWSIMRKFHKDRMNWVTVERCRKCSDMTQVQWCMEFVNGKFTTTCERTPVTLVEKV